MDKEVQTTELWDMYRKGVNYQDSINLRVNIPRYMDFFEGRQWRKDIPKGTETMPRCVINIIKSICRNKKANILSVPHRLVFSSLLNPEKAEMFTRFAEYQNKAMNMKKLDDDAVDSSTKAGTYIYHYYWDKDATHVIEGNKGGAVKCELLDPLNVFFANPCEVDEQKQKWILIKSRVDAETLKDIADKGVNLDLIEHDEEDDNAYEIKEQDGSNLVTLLTRYFRKDGEVYCERATKATIINKPFSITPDLESAKKELKADAPEVPETDTNTKRIIKAKLYPIAVGQYERRNKCIYGIGEVEGIIPNQQAINQMISMQVYNVQQNGWAKWKVTPKALNGQKITNDAGQVIVDYDPSGNGISKIKDEGFSTAPTKITEDVISMTRNASGSNEVTNGEVLGANMSGSAIAQLQAQASLPTEELRKNFWDTKIKCGRVLAQFLLLFYNKTKFAYVEETDPKQEVKIADFNIADYKDMTPESFDVQVEAIGGTKATTASDIQFLETMFNKGAIDALTFAKLYPNDAIANKTEVTRALAEAQQSLITQLTQQLQQAQQELQQAGQIIEKQGAIVDKAVPIIQENNTLKGQLISLYGEATTKIAMADTAIREYGAVKEDAEIFANEIARERGAQAQPQPTPQV